MQGQSTEWEKEQILSWQAHERVNKKLLPHFVLFAKQGVVFVGQFGDFVRLGLELHRQQRLILPRETSESERNKKQFEKVQKPESKFVQPVHADNIQRGRYENTKRTVIIRGQYSET